MHVRTDNASLPLDIVMTLVCALLRYILVVLAAAVVALWAAPGVRADPAAVTSAAYSADRDRERLSREYLIKAAILFNLAKFATWPDSAFSTADTPVRICILGRDPFGASLETLQGKQIGPRNLVTTAIANLENVAACHVLFVSASEEHRLAPILDAVSGRPVLTVADMDKFAIAGGIVGLTELDDRSRLEVNIGAADQAGVKLSSKLLRLAETVDTHAARATVAPGK
jgi:hypothetical protein